MGASGSVLPSALPRRLRCFGRQARPRPHTTHPLPPGPRLPAKQAVLTVRERLHLRQVRVRVERLRQVRGGGAARDPPERLLPAPGHWHWRPRRCVAITDMEAARHRACAQPAVGSGVQGDVARYLAPDISSLGLRATRAEITLSKAAENVQEQLTLQERCDIFSVTSKQIARHNWPEAQIQNLI